jgi:hypothetical protein
MDELEAATISFLSFLGFFSRRVSVVWGFRVVRRDFCIESNRIWSGPTLLVFVFAGQSLLSYHLDRCPMSVRIHNNNIT